MTVLVCRSLGSFLLAGLLASSAFAGVPDPDPTNSSLPAYVYAVGTVNQGAQPDPYGRAKVVYRDPSTGNPAAGALITLDFSGCCDLAFCAVVLDGQTLDCAGKKITGVTNGAGEFEFTLLGATADPGDLKPPAQYQGGGPACVKFLADWNGGTITLGVRPVVSLDQNGAAGRSNGTTGSDVSALINLYGSIALGAPYQSRGDLNADAHISGADVASLIGHVGRLAVLGGAGCTGSFCSASACP